MNEENEAEGGFQPRSPRRFEIHPALMMIVSAAFLFFIGWLLLVPR